MRYIFSILFFPFFFFHPENVFDITESLFLVLIEKNLQLSSIIIYIFTFIFSREN